MKEIKVERLSKAYGEKQVLNNFCAAFPCGATTVLMGPSGCGKTTLLRLLAGLEQPDSGTISNLPEKKSMIFQEDRLCENVGALSNLRLCTPALSKKEGEKRLSDLGLADSLRQPVREFSGGMKRRVAILRALCAEYDLLLADEPFKGLDEETRLRTMEYFRSQTQGKTVLLVTHEEEEAAFFGNVLKLTECQF